MAFPFYSVSSLDIYLVTSMPQETNEKDLNMSNDLYVTVYHTDIKQCYCKYTTFVLNVCTSGDP